jgi:glycine/D-amino acid oxidase-like deaminating enzyme
MTKAKKLHVAVVGAGAFGGWTALELQRRGARVTLIDAWGPGNSRASSGGETRVIRAIYGGDRIYTEMAVRSLQLWREQEARWNRKLFQQTGVLWMVGEEDGYEMSSLPFLRELRLPFEEMTPPGAAKRYPQINFEGIQHVILEQQAGYLLAREACGVVRDAFLAEGGEYRELAVTPGELKSGRMEDIGLSDGPRLAADSYVFACGAWLEKLFPEILGQLIRPTRQEVFFFGTPPGDPRFAEASMPVWVDHGDRFRYGIPGSDRRGFKVADDTRGAPFDPTSDERLPSAEGLKAIRDYLSFRFPALRDAPLLEARICPYEDTPDHHFILDRHPEAGNVWLVGGGSGHGFKHGPAVGERVASLVVGETVPEPLFALARFAPS